MLWVDGIFELKVEYGQKPELPASKKACIFISTNPLWLNWQCVDARTQVSVHSCTHSIRQTFALGNFQCKFFRSLFPSFSSPVMTFGRSEKWSKMPIFANFVLISHQSEGKCWECYVIWKQRAFSDYHIYFEDIKKCIEFDGHLKSNSFWVQTTFFVSLVKQSTKLTINIESLYESDASSCCCSSSPQRHNFKAWNTHVYHQFGENKSW